MKKVAGFTITSLIVSFILAYLLSFFTFNEDILAFFYSLGVFVTVLLFNGTKSITFEKSSKALVWIFLGFSLPLVINIYLSANQSGLGLFSNINSYYFSSILPFLLIVSAAFFEESGWRGYLFNELKNMSWLKMNLVVSFYWSIWHLPVILSGYAGIDPPRMLSISVYLMNFFIMSLVFGWLRQKTGGLIAPVMLHGSLNFFGLLFNLENTASISAEPELKMTLLFLTAILILHAWKKPK